MVTKDNIDDVCATLFDVQELALDCETTGLERTDLPFAVIIANAGAEYYFDERGVPGFWDHHYFRELLAQPRVWIYQNAKFDLSMLLRKGITMAGSLVDTKVLARLHRNDHLAYSLDDQAKRILGKPKDARVMEYIKANDLYSTRTDFFGEEYKSPQFDKVPLELMCEYACTDARLTYDLYVYYMRELDQGSHRIAGVESDLIQVCLDIEERGILIDQEYTLSAMYKEQAKVDELIGNLEQLTGMKYVNSAKAWEPWFNSKGVTLPRTINKKTRCETKNPCLDDGVLDWLAGHPTGVSGVAKLIQEVRKYEKRISTYYRPYLVRQDKGHVIHASMEQAGTTTGRFSYREPNLQNIPKKEAADDNAIRGCFVPRPGHIFVSMDYSQQEYRMMAAYAGEMKVIKEVMAGKDFHQGIADMIGIERDPAKTLNFAVLYGAGAAKIAKMLKQSLAQAARLKTAYYLALPRVESFIDAVINTGKARGYVTNWMGRRLYARREFCYALPNHLIQGGGADVVKVAMVRVAQKFPVPMVLQIHDQLVFEMTIDQYAYIPEIKAEMENVFELNGMKLTVDVSWSAKSLAERDMQKGIPDVTGLGEEEISSSRLEAITVRPLAVCPG